MTSKPDPQSTSLQRLRAISDLLDNAIQIPGTSYGVGLDPLLGLIPGGGDLIGFGFSLYIVIEAYRLGLPTSALTRMAGHILIDMLLGLIPVLGDIFDVAWKANAMNLAIIESHLQSPSTSTQKNQVVIWAILGGLTLLALGIAFVSFKVVEAVWQVLFP